MARVDRLARRMEERKMGNEEFTKMLAVHGLRTERKRSVLENLCRAPGDGAARATAAIGRNVETVDDSRGGA